jgi:hypothetical protein
MSDTNWLDRLAEASLHAAATQGEPIVVREPGTIVDLLGSIYLYVNWRYVTKQLTTEQKETWAAAVEAWSAALNADTDERPHKADRWWLCQTCGINNREPIWAGPHDEPCGRYEDWLSMEKDRAKRA